MSSKFQLTPEPTFVAPVNIHVPGGKPHPVKFTFKFRTPDEYREFLDAVKEGKDDVATIKEVVTGWDLPQPFDDENIATLVKTRFGVVEAVFLAYSRELIGAREKN